MASLFIVVKFLSNEKQRDHGKNSERFGFESKYNASVFQFSNYRELTQTTTALKLSWTIKKSERSRFLSLTLVFCLLLGNPALQRCRLVTGYNNVPIPIGKLLKYVKNVSMCRKLPICIHTVSELIICKLIKAFITCANNKNLH